ncbi:hypothetical protein ACCC92_26270 [Mucilaginibacter sp. Mucisp84]
MYRFDFSIQGNIVRSIS